jgi:hypothetical protein
MAPLSAGLNTVGAWPWTTIFLLSPNFEQKTQFQSSIQKIFHGKSPKFPNFQKKLLLPDFHDEIPTR